MNLQLKLDHILKNNVPQDYSIPRRSQVFVGFGCHQKCGFCYYKNRCGDGMFDRDYVLRQIDVELEYGIKDFEFTGGEPSECEDMRFYCEYIKRQSPDSKIAVITNGGLWRCNVWDLIDEVLVSYHLSKCDKLYNKDIFPLGTTYDKVVRTIECARNNGKTVRTNTVIGTFNIHDIDGITNDIIQDLKPDIVNFLPVNLFDEAEKHGMDKFIDYGKLRPVLKNSIDKIEKSLINTLVFVRFMPFCDMEGYEKNIVGTLQHIYDFFDWNVELCGYNMMEYLKKYKNNSDIMKYLGKFGSRTYEKAFDSINASYEKGNKCLKCKYCMICDGVEKTKGSRLVEGIVPIKGEIVKNFMEFIGNVTERKYNEIYSK